MKPLLNPNLIMPPHEAQDFVNGIAVLKKRYGLSIPAVIGWIGHLMSEEEIAGMRKSLENYKLYRQQGGQIEREKTTIPAGETAADVPKATTKDRKQRKPRS